MRDIGYSLETAIADLIDNSITAGATEIDVWLRFGNNQPPSIALVDNGSGMTGLELKDAMTPGCRDPLDERAPDDLGRFGLGLKTASFSQCRRLTVITRKDGALAAARWDLDRVRVTNDWSLQILSVEDLEHTECISQLPAQGTMVVWEAIDRIVDATSGENRIHYLTERMEDARRHIETVFHRFIKGEPGRSKTAIRWNGSLLESFDPFHSKHPATQAHPPERMDIDGEGVTVQAFILPHHSKLKPKEWERYATAKGYLRSQGFYVYRAGRLIIHSTWFGLVRASELTRLARVRVDIPTSLDHLWKIDVRKASAQPPYIVKRRLKNIIDRILQPTRRVYSRRGHTRAVATDSLWVRNILDGAVSYRINREHPALVTLLGELEGDAAISIGSVLAAIEQAFPLDAIFADYAAKPDSLAQPALSDDDCAVFFEMMFTQLAGQGLSAADAVARLERNPAYKMNPESASRFLAQFHSEHPDG